jgi:ATP-dependent DNA helicase RecQ
MLAQAQSLLQQMLGPDAAFRPGQWEAIEAVALRRQRVLVVQLVREGKYHHGRFADDLVEAAVALIRDRWRPDPAPAWVTSIPSCRHPHLVPDYAGRLATALGLPFTPVLLRVADVPEQKTMANSVMQARNVRGSLAVAGDLPAGPVLLVDDIIDSGWTLTLAGWLLRRHGSGPVHPFTLARATPRNA